MVDALTLKIHYAHNGKKRQTSVLVPSGATVMDAITEAGQKVPHFCYHKRLSVAGNCRMCLVEIAAPDRTGKMARFSKPIASCHYPAAEGMEVHLNSAQTKQAQANTMQFLLANHPLDCPICDQGGQCDLQDMAYAYGSDVSTYNEPKRAVKDPNLGTKIKTVMTRCIHCSRCVRFATEVAGVEDMGMTGRGETTEVGTYVAKALHSPLAGNMIDLCPVGALTNKPQAFTSRPWELDKVKSIDPHDALGSHLWLTKRFDKVIHILPRECDAINEEWATDRARFSVDALSTNRLTTPLIKRGKGHSTTSWQEAFEKLVKLHDGVDSVNIAGGCDVQLGLEDLYVFQQFMRQSIGTNLVEAIHITRAACFNLANWRTLTLKKPLKDFETATHIIEVGFNSASDVPLLDLRLRRAVKQGATLTRVHSAADLAKALKGKMLADCTVICRSDCVEFMPDEILNHDDFHVLPELFGTLNAVCLTPKKIEHIAPKLKAGDCVVLWLYGDVPPSKLYREAAEKGTKIVYIGTHHNPIADLADVVLPSAAFTEKNWRSLNAWGELQSAEQAVPPPGEAKEDWQIFRKLSEVFNPERPLPFNTFAELQTQAEKTMGEGEEAYVPNPKTQAIGWEQKGYEAGSKQAHYTANGFLAQSATMQAMEVESS